MRTFLVASILLVACTRDSGGDPPRAHVDTSHPKVVLVADTPSHGPGEHEYFAGVTILAGLLQQTPGVATVVLRGFPDDMHVFDDATAIVLQTNGRDIHPLAPGDRMSAIAKVLERGVGFTCIHWSTEPPAPIAPRVMDALGGRALYGPSVFEIWHASFPALPDHPITRGVRPFDVDEEYYFGLSFADGITPILSAAPPDALRKTPETAAHMGQKETLAWTYERPSGGRSFGYTGAHFHANWGREEIRRLVVNGILWTAGLEIPSGGAPVALDPARLAENLDKK